MSTYWEVRAARITEAVSIEDLLLEYGYDIRHNGVEQQFSCDLHGSNDEKPSARVYPESNSFYCFGCQKNRDVIQLVIDKEGVNFKEACSRLEKFAGLEPLEYKGEVKVSEPVLEDSEEEYKEAWDKINKFLTSMTKEREFEFEDCVAFWEAFDAVTWRIGKKKWSYRKGLYALESLRVRIVEKIS